MSTGERDSLWFIPRTTIGKTLLAGYLVSLIAVSLPLHGIAFNDPELLGPLPEAVAWTYLWYAMINLVVIGTYYKLFQPWAVQAAQYVDEGSGVTSSDSLEEAPPAGTQSTRGGDD